MLRDKRRPILLVASAALLLLCLALGGVAISLRSVISQTTTHQEQWEALGVDNYWMTIEWIDLGGNIRPCYERILVFGDEQLSVEDECPYIAMANLDTSFELFDRYDESGACDLLGCTCGTTRVLVQYQHIYH